MDFRVILILIAEALFAFLLLLRAGVLKSRRVVFRCCWSPRPSPCVGCALTI